MSHLSTAMPRAVAPPAYIPLSRLRRDRRADQRVVRALLAHIRRTGLYPPLIVAASPESPGQYDILDGAARAEALARLGIEHARCEVWPVEPTDLPLLGLAFRRLSGRQDVAGQSGRLRQLARDMPAAELATLLGATPRALRRQLAALEGPPRPTVAPEALSLTPVVFHLDAAGHRRLELALANLAGRDTDTAGDGCATHTAEGGSTVSSPPNGPATSARRGRGELLMTLLEGNNHD